MLEIGTLTVCLRPYSENYSTKKFHKQDTFCYTKIIYSNINSFYISQSRARKRVILISLTRSKIPSCLHLISFLPLYIELLSSSFLLCVKTFCKVSPWLAKRNALLESESTSVRIHYVRNFIKYTSVCTLISFAQDTARVLTRVIVREIQFFFPSSLSIRRRVITVILYYIKNKRNATLDHTARQRDRVTIQYSR
jgi:hypothetical protein